MGEELSDNRSAQKPARYVVAIDTATDTVVTGVARIDDEPQPVVSVVAQRAVADGRRHAEIATTLIGECLTEAGIARSDLAAVVVGTGPGPFTGLRVGMATGAAFGDALDIDVYGVCSLDAIAAAAAVSEAVPDSMLVVTDARRREVYWAHYRNGSRDHGPAVVAPAALARDLGVADLDGIEVVAGSSAHLRLVGWTGDDPTVAVPTVGGLVAAALPALRADEPPAPLIPLYLRRPDAVERTGQQQSVSTP